MNDRIGSTSDSVPPYKEGSSFAAHRKWYHVRCVIVCVCVCCCVVVTAREMRSRCCIIRTTNAKNHHRHRHQMIARICLPSHCFCVCVVCSFFAPSSCTALNWPTPHDHLPAEVRLPSLEGGYKCCRVFICTKFLLANLKAGI